MGADTGPEGEAPWTVPYPADAGVDPDFAREVLEDLYAYPRKRPVVAWLLWLLTGWFGGHRFYLERPGTGVLMFLSGGGFLVWWTVDAFLLAGMVRAFNGEQSRRQREGEPPVNLEFLPARADFVEAAAGRPAWAEAWGERGRAGRLLRLAGDLLVLLMAGVGLGAVSAATGNYRAAAVVAALVAVTILGGRPSPVWRLPVGRDLVRWSHRLRLFYSVHRPGTPPELLLRPVVGLFVAPFRRAARAEVRLYLELGGVAALVFLVVEAGAMLLPELLPFLPGAGWPGAEGLLERWLEDAAFTFVNVYAFAAPIGAVLTLHLLTRRTHVLARALAVAALAAVAWGAWVG